MQIFPLTSMPMALAVSFEVDRSIALVHTTPPEEL